MWGNDFSSWLGILDELGLQPVAVIVSSLDSLDLIRHVVGVDCFVGVATDFEAVLLPSLHGRCRLGLVDGRLSTTLCELATKLDLSNLIGTVGLRRPIPGWTLDTLSLRHCEVGGITTTLTQGVCLTRGVTPPTM